MRSIIVCFFFLGYFVYPKCQTFNDIFLNSGVYLPYYLTKSSKFENSIKIKSIPKLSYNFQVGTNLKISNANSLKFGILFNNSKFEQKYSNILFGTDIINNTETTIYLSEDLYQIGTEVTVNSKKKNNISIIGGIQFYKVFNKTDMKKVTGAGLNENFIINGNINEFSKSNFSILLGAEKLFKLPNNLKIGIVPYIRIELKPQYFFISFKSVSIVPQLSISIHKFIPNE